MIDLTPATVASCPVITGKGLLSLPYPTPFNDEMIPKLIGSYGDKQHPMFGQYNLRLTDYPSCLRRRTIPAKRSDLTETRLSRWHDQLTVVHIWL